MCWPLDRLNVCFHCLELVNKIRNPLNCLNAALLHENYKAKPDRSPIDQRLSIVRFIQYFDLNFSFCSYGFPNWLYVFVAGLRNIQQIKAIQQRKPIESVGMGRGDCYNQLRTDVGLPQEWTYWGSSERSPFFAIK